MNEIKYLLKRKWSLFHYKWIKGRCRHLCVCCEFYKNCNVELIAMLPEDFLK